MTQAPAPLPEPSPAPAPLGTGGAQAVTWALSLLSLVGRGGNAGLGPALTAGITRPTARRFWQALGTAFMIEQDPQTRRYHLGPKACFWGNYPIRTPALMRGDRKPMGIGVGALAILSAPPLIDAKRLMQHTASLNPALIALLQRVARLIEFYLTTLGPAPDPTARKCMT